MQNPFRRILHLITFCSNTRRLSLPPKRCAKMKEANDETYRIDK